jgi:hypothetical protein
MIGLIVSKNMATFKELDEYYGMEDVLNMIEIITVDAFNDYQLSKPK